MFSNERSSHHGHASCGETSPEPSISEATLKAGKIQIERKVFTFALKENLRGRYLRITEDVGGRHDTIIVPAPGLAEFKQLLDEMVKASAEIPGKTG